MIREQSESINEVQRRLAGCFTAVFGTLAEADVPRAAVGSVEGWDSMATVTLITVIEEEFGIQIAADDIERFASFEQALRYLETRERDATR